MGRASNWDLPKFFSLTCEPEFIKLYRQDCAFPLPHRQVTFLVFPTRLWEEIVPVVKVHSHFNLFQYETNSGRKPTVKVNVEKNSRTGGLPYTASCSTQGLLELKKKVKEFIDLYSKELYDRFKVGAAIERGNFASSKIEIENTELNELMSQKGSDHKESETSSVREYNLDQSSQLFVSETTDTSSTLSEDGNLDDVDLHVLAASSTINSLRKRQRFDNFPDATAPPVLPPLVSKSAVTTTMNEGSSWDSVLYCKVYHQDQLKSKLPMLLNEKHRQSILEHASSLRDSPDDFVTFLKTWEDAHKLYKYQFGASADLLQLLHSIRLKQQQEQEEQAAKKEKERQEKIKKVFGEECMKKTLGDAPL